MTEVKKLAIVVEPSAPSGDVDFESKLVVKLMKAKLSCAQHFDLVLLDRALDRDAYWDLINEREETYIIVMRDDQDMTLNYVAEFTRYLAKSSVYMAEPYVANAVIPKNFAKLARNQRYFYARNTFHYGIAFNRERLLDLETALGRVDLTTLYINYRAYFGIAKVNALAAGYSISSVTFINNGIVPDADTVRLFTRVPAPSEELRIYILRYMVLFIRALRTTKRTALSVQDLAETVAVNRLVALAKYTETRDRFEVFFVRWLASPAVELPPYKMRGDEDAYWSFSFPGEDRTPALYELEFSDDVVEVRRQYRPHAESKAANNPAVFDFYSRPVTEDSTILFFDRGAQADDNAEYLYEYFREHYPQYKNAYFALYDTSPDWARLEAKGFRLIKLFSPEFNEKFLESDLVVSSQIFNTQFGGKNFSNSRFVYLQHGVQLNDMTDWVASKYFDIFVATGKPEADYLSRIAPMETLNVGLPRYQSLERMEGAEDHGNIVFMPTWRFNLAGVSNSEFRRSEYFKNINGLLNSPKLRTYLEQSGRKLVVKMHPNAAARASLFNIPPGVEITTDSYRSVIQSAALVVTDYSSVVVDAAFIRTPIAYFQWDRDDFFESQPYGERLDYVEQGMGPVFYTMDETLDYIVTEKFLEEDPIYETRRQWFFEGVDKETINERIIQTMLSL